MCRGNCLFLEASSVIEVCWDQGLFTESSGFASLCHAKKLWFEAHDNILLEDISCDGWAVFSCYARQIFVMWAMSYISGTLVDPHNHKLPLNEPPYKFIQQACVKKVAWETRLLFGRDHAVDILFDGKSRCYYLSHFTTIEDDYAPHRDIGELISPVDGWSHHFSLEKLLEKKRYLSRCRRLT